MDMDELWQIRPAFGDAWLSDMLSKESEAVTMALHKSLTSESSYEDDVLSAGVAVESFFAVPDVTPVTTPTVSGGSENEDPVSKQRRRIAPSGKVAKRKSRASKRAITTFIAADPSHFREMVQQVTGFSFCGVDGQKLPVTPLLKPEPHRLISTFQSDGGFSAFDSSAFLLDTSGWSSLASQIPTPAVPLGVAAAATVPEFDSFCGFPTLESWKVM